MRKWKEDFLFLCRNKAYIWLLSLTAVFSYGFLVTHQTVGIDDTPYDYYFNQGLNAIVGRWFLFLLNKVFHIADFTPFLTDLAGVLVLMAAVTVWCTLLYSICRDRVSIWGYLFFSCIFLSCPLISEVYTYYLHNGVSIGYLFTGVSLCFFRELAQRRSDRKKLWIPGIGTAVFLFMALGCYESFMMVWLLGVFLVLLTERYAGIGRKAVPALCAGAAAAVAAILLRSLMIAAVTGIFGLGDMRDEAVQRSVTELVGWIFEPDAAAEFAMVLKRMFVQYGVFGYAYYPIKIFVLAAVVMVVFGLYRSIRQKDVRCILLTLGSFFGAFLLVFVEGSATLYRSAQFLPVICGYGAFLVAYAISGLKNASSHGGAVGRGRLWRNKICGGAAVFVLSVVLWNQCFEMNKWFYVDYLKYEDVKDVLGQVSQRLERDFDCSRPVVFTGNYLPPYGIVQDAYVNYNTPTFFRMKRITDLVDEYLLSKYYRQSYGVWVAQTPALSVIDWGFNAFENDAELVRFFDMHGYAGILANMDSALYETAQLYSVDLPSFPAEGSIVDMGEYIIVHF